MNSPSDSSLLHELKTIRQLPIAQQLPPLREIVKNNPDYTPAAIFLFIALRQAGLLKGRVDTTGAENGPIPRRIVQYWDETKPPEDIRALMNSWRERTRNSNMYFLTTRAHKIS